MDLNTKNKIEICDFEIEHFIESAIDLIYEARAQKEAKRKKLNLISRRKIERLQEEKQMERDFN